MAKIKGWVLYDGACGFCTWWIPMWRKTIQKTGYHIAPLQARWVRERLQLAEADLNKDILLLKADGSLLHGADAYIFGMQRVWWSKPMGYLLALPGFKWLTWQFYKIFNRNRFLVSKVCRMPAGLDEAGYPLKAE